MRPWFVLVCGVLAFPVQAEMAGDDYQTEAGSLSPEERDAAPARLAAEIEAERARAEDAARKAQAEAEARAAARAARPLGERLVEARCLTCHDTRQIDAAGYGTIGWTVTVMRMEFLNGVTLQSGERGVIVSHLSARSQGRATLEWALVIMAAAALTGAVLGVRRWLRGRIRR